MEEKPGREVLRTPSDLQGRALGLKSGELGSGAFFATPSLCNLGPQFPHFKRRALDWICCEGPYGSHFWESE